MKPVPVHATIRDVARKAGVGTVSRVLNRGPVSVETRARVRAAIQGWDFRPHAAARRILRRSGMICFLICNRTPRHPFHAWILQGVENCAARLKQHVIYTVAQFAPPTPPRRIPVPPILQERGWVDGLILTGLIYENFLQRIQGLHIPFVALANNVVTSKGAGDFDQVGFDEYKGTCDATQYLIACGHRLIVFIGDTSLPWFKERYRAYIATVRANGLTPCGLTERTKDNDFHQYGERAGTQILAMEPRATAVVAGNDEIAIGVWQTLLRNGLTVPLDMSVVGFDDREEALLMHPPLTTVRVYKQKTGEALMELEAIWLC
jgi:LacI family transcriptional regulator